MVQYKESKDQVNHDIDIDDTYYHDHENYDNHDKKQ